MPAFFPSHLPRQPTLTPEEQYGADAFSTPSAFLGITANDARFAFESHDKYGMSKRPNAMREPFADYTQPAINGFSDALVRREKNCGQIAPILPPIRVPDNIVGNTQVRSHPGLPGSHAVANYAPQQNQQQPKEEKVAGGVSAHLDYEMEQMVDFVAEMARGMYDLFETRLCLADIDVVRSVQPNSSVCPSFRKFVMSILTSTRLPSSTILLALHYLSTRLSMLSAQGMFTSSQAHLYHMLTTALMLASKFLDDNTFQNRSWAEVSRISVKDLNKHETEWLLDIKWTLHIDPTDSQGFGAWLRQWERWQLKRAEESMEALKLTTVDTTVHHQQHIPHNYLPPTPIYTPVHPDGAFNFGVRDRSSPTWPQWPSHRALSPPSAMHSGPTTPEWYGKHSSATFGSQTQLNYSARLPLPVQALPTPPYYNSYAPHYSMSVWGRHGVGCGCTYCAMPGERYTMPNAYGIQSVAG